MAKVIFNRKKFKVIEVSKSELAKVYENQPLCDSCRHDTRVGYLIAVLNEWFCPVCYGKWSARSIYYTQDKRVEDRNFERHKQLFKIV